MKQLVDTEVSFLQQLAIHGKIPDGEEKQSGWFDLGFCTRCNYVTAVEDGCRVVEHIMGGVVCRGTGQMFKVNVMTCHYCGIPVLVNCYNGRVFKHSYDDGETCKGSYQVYDQNAK